MKEKMKKIFSTIWKVWPYVLAVIIPIVDFWLFESFTYVPFTNENMSIEAQILNILFYWVICIILANLFGKVGIALLVETILSLCIAVVNYYVIQFRSSPILPWDLLSTGTALSVVDNFNIEIKHDTLVLMIKFAFVVILCITAIRKKKNMHTKKVLIRRGICLAGGIVMLIILNVMVWQENVVQWAGLNTTLFTPTVMCRDNGFAVTFMMDMQYMKIGKPSGYNKADVENTLKKYKSDDGDGAKKSRPNIIVVMDECFSDPAVLCSFNTEKDYMPFVHRLMNGAENTVSGYLHVSVLGGNTANTEYEFLTGNTMTFLPSGSIPYQQYISDEIPSFVSDLKALGYTTNAIHPYYSTGWNREKVYNYMGFDNTYFIDSFDSDAEIIRKYVSDSAAFKKVTDVYEEERAPIFTFLVTMQNHSGFGQEYSGFNPDVVIDGTDSKYPRNYLYLMKITDSAIQNLIEYYSKEEEDTVVVFFGDHQPYDIIVDPLLRMNGMTCDMLQQTGQTALRYEVPYFIWANFDIDEAQDVDSSPNYLASQVLDICNVKMTEYQNYLLDLSKNVPVISTQCIENSDGKIVSQDDKSVVKFIEKYRQIQYYREFDYK